jgi:hypothetical protein
MPDDLVSGATGDTSGAGAGASPAAETSAPAAAPSGGVAAPSAAPAGGPIGGGESDYVGIRDALASYGIDLRQQFQDDHAALQHLALAYQQNQQSQRLAQYGQLYLQHADSFNRYLQQQAEAQRQQQVAQAQSWWRQPDFDPRWASQIARDPQTGEYRALPGADPSVVNRYLQWQEHQRSFLERFSYDPIRAIQPGIEEVARRVAAEVVGQNLGGYRDQQAAQGLVDSNSYWLHSHDAAGNVVRDPLNGAPQLSEWGKRFHAYVTKAQQMGLRDVQGQWDFAMASVQRDHLLSERGGASAVAPAAQPVDQNEAAKAQFLQAAAAMRTPNQSGSTQGGGGAGSQNGSLSFRERAARDLQAGGFGPGTILPLPGGR